MSERASGCLKSESCVTAVFSHALLHKEKCRALFVHPSFSPYTNTMSHLAVYGGAGALGRALVTYFKERGFVSTTPT